VVQMCSNALQPVNFNALVNNGNGMIWSTNGGGNFIGDVNSPFITYVPSPNDPNQGNVKITLKVKGKPGCDDVTKDAMIFFDQPNNLVIAPVGTACANLPFLVTALGDPGNITWDFVGLGSIMPFDDRTITYFPNELDNQVIFSATLESTNSCPDVTKVLAVPLMKVPTVNAGPDQVIQAGDPVAVNANINNGNMVGWFTSGDGTFLQPNQAATIYQHGFADQMNGGVQLTVRAVNVCGMSEDNMMVLIRSNSDDPGDQDSTDAPDDNPDLPQDSLNVNTGNQGSGGNTPQDSLGNNHNNNSADSTYQPSDTMYVSTDTSYIPPDSTCPACDTLSYNALKKENEQNNHIYHKRYITSILLPNPATSHAWLSINSDEKGSAEVKLINHIGQTIAIISAKFGNRNSLIELPIENLPSGSYYVSLKTTDGYSKTLPLIIQR
ncbi:MAG: T9SS type A sorting domain-containing protein, partial [Chitinophagales bacterium]|nr:T9SS type A sorting domain-containing protein [Chitinophagales bacterium]